MDEPEQDAPEPDGFDAIDDDTPLACGLADIDYCESCQ
jgi:hypothetical protein